MMSEKRIEEIAAEVASPASRYLPYWRTAVDFARAIEAECRKVPAGYVPVPVEPTASQLDVAVSFALNVKLCNDYNWSAYMRDVYARMIAAAPKPAEPEGREHLPDGCGLIHEPVAQEPAEWECFEDTSYYNMWAVRPVGEMQWGKCFHLANNAEAETLCAVLNMQPDKSAEVERLRMGLENCRLLAARHRKEDWALMILGFCAEAGVVGSVTR